MTAAQVRGLGLVAAAGDVALVVIYALLASGAVSSYTLGALFNLDGEATIPAWYSSAQLLLTGALLLWAATTAPTARGETAPPDRPGHAAASGRFLAALGIAFCFLSLDETAGIHETITVVLRPFEALPRFSGDHGMWIPIYLALGAAFLVATARHWRALWGSDRRGAVWLAGGAFLFLAGAVGLEVLSYGALREGPRGGLYMLQVAFEEGLELLGATAMLVGAAQVAAHRTEPAP